MVCNVPTDVGPAPSQSFEGNVDLAIGSIESITNNILIVPDEEACLTTS